MGDDERATQEGEDKRSCKKKSTKNNPKIQGTCEIEKWNLYFDGLMP